MKISEMFASIQGEGVTVGVPSYFIRLTGCNFNCKWCDTLAVWKTGVDYTNEQVEDSIYKVGQLERVRHGDTHLIFTGGEPTIKHHRDDIMRFVKHLKGTPFIEVETNGSNFCEDGFYDWVAQVNCSPKLKNSGVPDKLRINPDALQQINETENSWFKFVVSNEADIEEIKRDFIDPGYVREGSVILMPEVMSKVDIAERTKMVWQLAMKHNFMMCTRLHVLCFDKTVNI